MIWIFLSPMQCINLSQNFYHLKLNNSFVNTSIHQNQTKTRLSGRNYIEDGVFVYTFDDKWGGWSVGEFVENYYNPLELPYPTGIVDSDPSKCPENLIVPRQVGSEPYDVEIVNVGAFGGCMDMLGAPTKSVLITKQVKVIREYAFMSMTSASFKIERECELEVIEDGGITVIVSIESDLYGSETLVLPSSISTIGKNAFVQMYLFKEIVYCGFNDLSNGFNDMESDYFPTFKVSPYYHYNNFLGNKVVKEDISKICSGYVYEHPPPPIVCSPNRNIRRTVARQVSLTFSPLISSSITRLHLTPILRIGLLFERQRDNNGKYIL